MQIFQIVNFRNVVSSTLAQFSIPVQKKKIYNLLSVLNFVNMNVSDFKRHRSCQSTTVKLLKSEHHFSQSNLLSK